MESSDSVWAHKPWWCQPWTIALTGCILIGVIVVVVPWAWVKLLFAAPIALWMVFFIFLYPKMMQDYLTQLANQPESSRDQVR